MVGGGCGFNGSLLIVFLYQVLCPNVDEVIIQSISQTLMSVYTLKDNCIESDESNSS